MCKTVAPVFERAHASKSETAFRRYWRIRGRLLITGLAALFATGLTPCLLRAGIIGSPVTAGGYTFTNFDFSPLTGTAVGSNANGISNTGQAVGTTVDVNNASTFTNFAGTPAALTQLNTGADQIAFGINSAGDVVGGNGTNAFFLPNGGSVQTLTTPAGAVNAFGINDNGNIVGQFTSGGNTPGFVLGSSTSMTFTTINQPTGVTADVINAQGINNSGLVVGFYLGNDGQVHGLPLMRLPRQASSRGRRLRIHRYRRWPENQARRLCSRRSSGSTITVLPPVIMATPRLASTAFYTTRPADRTLFWTTQPRGSVTAWRSRKLRESTTRARSPDFTPMPMASLTALWLTPCPNRHRSCRWVSAWAQWD